MKFNFNNEAVYTQYEKQLLKDEGIIGYVQFDKQSTQRIAFITEYVSTDYDFSSYIKYKIGGITESHKTRTSRFYDQMEDTKVKINKAWLSTKTIIFL